MKIYKSTAASIRIDPNNPDHHLFNNHGIWWVHYTVYPDNCTSKRIRRSLQTDRLETARLRRDKIFQSLFQRPKDPLEVYFYPNKLQIRKIEDLALEMVDLDIHELIERYNRIARQGLSVSEGQWIQLCAMRLAFHHYFQNPIIHFQDGRLSLNCLISIESDGSFIKHAADGSIQKLLPVQSRTIAQIQALVLTHSRPGCLI